MKFFVMSLLSDAAGKEVIHDKKHGGLPADPAKEAGEENPCGHDVKPDDQCGSPQLPNTVAIWTGSDRGETMTANPLTKCGPDGSDPTIRLPGHQCIRNAPKPVDGARETDFWVHAHLLHGVSGKDDLHGPGNRPENLIITDKSLNTLMSTRVENGTTSNPGAIPRIHQQNQTLSYRVAPVHVADSGDKRFFATGMRIDLDRIDPVTRAVTESIFHDTIISNKPRAIPANCT